MVESYQSVGSKMDKEVETTPQPRWLRAGENVFVALGAKEIKSVCEKCFEDGADRVEIFTADPEVNPGTKPIKIVYK
jgi:hypothetical protein